MNSSQKRTLAAIFELPTRSDIRWNEIESLLRALGACVTEGSGSRIRVALNGRFAVFHRPHPKPDTKKGAVEAVRRFLTSARIKT